MTMFRYKQPRPIYWFQVTSYQEINQVLLHELKRLAPWADAGECWCGDTEHPMEDVNQIIYNHNKIIANENRYSNFGTMITLIGTEITLEGKKFGRNE